MPKNKISQILDFDYIGYKISQILHFDYVGCSTEFLLDKLKTSPKGLTEEEAKKRLEEYGYNEPAKKETNYSFPNPFQIL